MHTHLHSKLVFVALASLSSFVAHADLSLSSLAPEQTVQIPVPGGRAEVCVIPLHLEGAKYSNKDLENERHLCEMDVRSNIAACPKLESTNPGLNFHAVPAGMTSEAVVARDCFVPSAKDPKKNAAKKVAKYKLSSSCSYTPSLLGYYHFSRILGGIGNVPVAVLRTFDRQDHLALADRAESEMASMIDSKKISANDVIVQTWRSLEAKLKKGDPAVIEHSGTQSYGALQKNPRGEEKYSELYNKGFDQPARTAAFRDQNPVFQALRTSAPVESVIGAKIYGQSKYAANPAIAREFNQANLQLFVQLRDVSEMIILDTLLNQQDRFGNLHYEFENYYQMLDPSGHPVLSKDGNIKIESDDDVPQAPEGSGYSIGKVVQAKTMIMKDNDCGVAKTNHLKNARLIEEVAHMNPKTYRRILDLHKMASGGDPAFMDFLKKDLLLSGSDIKSIGANLNYIVSTLKAKCNSGFLKLDLDLEAYFSGRPAAPVSCE